MFSKLCFLGKVNFQDITHRHPYLIVYNKLLITSRLFLNNIKEYFQRRMQYILTYNIKFRPV